MNPGGICRNASGRLSCARTFNSRGVNRQLAGLADELIHELADLAEVLGDLTQAAERGPDAPGERVQEPSCSSAT
jgi:hypothetical protein